MLGWEVVESQQFIPILDQAFGRLRIFRLEGFDEQIERSMGILAGLGLPDVVKHLLSLGLGALGEVIEHIARFMHPAALLARGWKNLFQCRPEPHGPVTGGQLRSSEPTGFEAEKHLAPALRAFPDAIFNGQKVLLATGVDPDHNEHAEPIISVTEPAVDAVRPDIDPLVTAQIGLAPIIVFRRPLAFQT